MSKIEKDSESSYGAGVLFGKQLHQLPSGSVWPRMRLMVCWVIIAIAISGCIRTHKVSPVNELLLSDASSRLTQLPCWFGIPENVPDTTCYRMYVPEVYGDLDSSEINFPVVKIASTEKTSKSPVLHLGGGISFFIGKKFDH